MAKNNPLFVDSTKFHGDRIGAQIELVGALIYDNEQLIVKIIDHQGETHRLPMQLMNESTYVARVWLQHQKIITYQFLIEKEGEIEFASACKEVRAQYAIISVWEPEFAEEPAKPSRAPSERLSLPLPDTPWTADYASTVESLIEKWGL